MGLLPAWNEMLGFPACRETANVVGFPPWDFTAKHRLPDPLSEMKNRAVRFFLPVMPGMSHPATPNPLPARAFALSVPLRAHRGKRGRSR